MKRNWVLTCVSLFVIFAICECGLRIAGINPGMSIQSRWFKQVDSLYLKQGFYADSNGIFKVEPKTRDAINARIKEAYASNSSFNYTGKYEISEVYSLGEEVIAFNDESSALHTYINMLSKSPVIDEADSALIDYANFAPINEDGFRSIAFKNYNTTKKKVLLLGDSFTWGHSADSKTNSFADLLSAKGYVVYNTGISGADPAQYLAIAEKYIAALKPDYVIVNFFMGNDVLLNSHDGNIKYFKREVLPYMPIHYGTNAGNILSCPAGIYLNSATEAYNFIVDQYSIPQTTITNKFLSLTACGTLLWKVLNRFHVASNKNKYQWYFEKTEALRKDKPTCNEELIQIENLCKQNNSKFLLVSINDIHYPKRGSPDKVPGLFEGIKYYPSPVDEAGYDSGDGHYNNEGHRVYADFLHKLMQAEDNR